MSKPTMSHGLHVSFNLPQIIIKQLADALTEIHSRGVFHRDIKLDNIVIETGPDGPRVRIIDFGSGTSLSEGIYTAEQGRLSFLLSSSEPIQHLCCLCALPPSLTIKLCLCVAVCILGTYRYTTPEWFLHSRYRAETDYGVAARSGAVWDTS